MITGILPSFHDVSNNNYSLRWLPASAVVVGNEQTLLHWLTEEIEFVELCRVSSYQQKTEGSGLADQANEVQTFARSLADKLDKLEHERSQAEIFRKAWKRRKRLEVVESTTGDIGPRMRKVLDSWDSSVLIVPGIDRLTRNPTAFFQWLNSSPKRLKLLCLDHGRLQRASTINAELYALAPQARSRARIRAGNFQGRPSGYDQKPGQREIVLRLLASKRWPERKEIAQIRKHLEAEHSRGTFLDPPLSLQRIRQIRADMREHRR